MRGFGHLIVVDHDDGFLSVYGNNRNLARSNGDAVRAGEVLAAVGNSGGGPETGLYFELRYQGQPIDPARWVGFR
ncbi:MAG TPA: peptidoglycan DD-metalloendopeptidase family protein, partial [Rhodocyclaceae bacterium]|nr:peptidoglycan DD-metalloendopeptidase family protein [Rhodocyclaceae bacterium]